jgi:hypothetical protein
MLPRILPFALYMAFLALESVLHGLGGWFPSLSSANAILSLWLYPIKIGVVLAAVVYFWSQYEELRRPLFPGLVNTLLTIAVGLGVYLAWVRMDWPWATQGSVTGYNPFAASASLGPLLAGIRLFGAAVVVPLMEELFWRSFLIRWLVASPFTAVPLGAFTAMSCAVTVVLFGLEHALWLAGMMAGLAYNLLLYQTRNLWSCILAHAITNLVLGLHVLITHEWVWW